MMNEIRLPDSFERIPAIIHPRFGDLSRPDAIVMPGYSPESYIERKSIFIHLTVTGKCNAGCRGCINMATGEGPRSSWQDTVPERDGRAIIELASLHPGETVTCCLYGGEPLLAPDRIAGLMETINESPDSERIRYLLYTNGELLNRAIASHPGVIEKIWLFAVSIDGQEAQHNSIRSGTSLVRIHGNLEALAALRKANVLMWSTLREEQSLLDCFREFQYLREKELAHHFFWHWVETSAEYSRFEEYASSYEADLRSVMETYVGHLERGDILSIIHLNELLLYLVSGKKRGSTGCGVEMQKNYDLMNGKIHACADLPPEFTIGEILEDGSISLWEKDLKPLTRYKSSLGCPDCGVHAYCGGRCPVQAIIGEPGRLLQYCQLMRLHVGAVNDYVPRILKAMEKNGITLQDLYDKSAYFAQFTDVTP